MKGFCATSLLCHIKVLNLITLGSLTKSYPLFYHVLCAVSMSLLCGGKCGIVIPGIFSSRMSFSSDSSALLYIRDIDLQLCLCYLFLFVVQGISGIREVCCYGYTGIGGINRLLMFLVVVVFCLGNSIVCIAAWSTC
ncbi:MAG: hypothetical protein EZS28_001301 [Streblomastix strix]|uniref:Uncharacterized protein n=1 Tax=Streblomastix strix TaxID=222440 RepID=A0A5J4X9B5_9EUKA|nr:MAG: hypothetical protein EZS28_001301 [Streblomastix strix]